jgi:hypothetical protein
MIGSKMKLYNEFEDDDDGLEYGADLRPAPSVVAEVRSTAISNELEATKSADDRLVEVAERLLTLGLVPRRISIEDVSVDIGGYKDPNITNPQAPGERKVGSYRDLYVRVTKGVEE